MAHAIKHAPFYNPLEVGHFDLATTQVGEPLKFSFEATIPATAKIVAFVGNTLIKTYSVGSGITLSDYTTYVDPDADPLAVDQVYSNGTATVLLSGTDFTDHVGQDVNFQASFFVEGRVEATFLIRIVKSYL